MTNDGGLCTQSPSTTDGTIHIHHPINELSPIQRPFIRIVGVEYNSQTGIPIRTLVEEKHVYVKNVTADGEISYQNVPEKLNELKNYQKVEVEFWPPCQEGHRDYELYRVIV